MSKKTLYRLKPKSSINHDFYVFDTETGIKNHEKVFYQLEARPEKFIFAVIYGYNFTKVLYSVDECKAEFLDSRYKNKLIFMHNAEYDLNTVFGNIYEMDNEAIFNGKFISASNGNCRFGDSMNILGQIKLSVVGEMLGKSKGKLGDEKFESFLEKSKISSKDINYCIRDCEIVYDALFMIFEDSGSIKLTQASLSMDYFKRFHLPFNVNYNENVKYFWESYYGGRTEAFYIGKCFARVIDVNSMYPFKMKTSVFPNPAYLQYNDYTSKKHFVSRILTNFEGCAKLTVIHKDHHFGFLPVKKGGKLIFPVGRFTGVWNFNEIRFALEHKVIEIEKYHYSVYSEPMESIFSGFVDTLYKKRYSTKNKFEIFRIKIFLNSLYGKFAQRITSNIIYIQNIDDQIDYIQELEKSGNLIKIIPFNHLRKDVFIKVKLEDYKTPAYSIPSFSSYITSAARVHLLKKALEFNHDEVLYCDTDSLFLKNKPIIEESKKLGDWSLEDKIVTEIRGLKNYSYEYLGEIFNKIKGVPKNAIEISPFVYEYFNLLKTKEALRRNMDAGINIKRTKKISNVYDKRVVNSDGTSKPIKLK